MTALALCILAFLICYWAGKRSLGQGLVALLAFGYAYGILRANLLTLYSHFIFDAGLLGLYISQSWGFKTTDSKEAKRIEATRFWVLMLLAWPILVAFMPFQPLMVSLVGLRGNAFFIPALLLGSRMREKDLFQLTAGLAVLNLVVLGFAGAEYFTGIARFYPVSSVTRIIYNSADVAGGFFRIPAAFTSAHAYGGTMVCTIPYLIGGWDRGRTNRARTLAVLGIAAALLGVLMSATRQNFVLGSVMVLVTLFTRRVKAGALVVFFLLVGAIGYLALTNDRFQRFKSLGDTDAVTERIAGSVNRGFWEILTEYPMGNGLGGGGSSIPYFLEGEVKNPIGMENEYARILCEQGIIGLLLFLGFAGWFLSRAKVAFAKGPWANGRRLAWSLAAFSLATAWIGIGFLTAIPQTVIQLVGMGWTSVPEAREDKPTRQVPVQLTNVGLFSAQDHASEAAF